MSNDLARELGHRFERGAELSDFEARLIARTMKAVEIPPRVRRSLAHDCYREYAARRYPSLRGHPLARRVHDDVRRYLRRWGRDQHGHAEPADLIGSATLLIYRALRLVPSAPGYSTLRTILAR